MSAIRMFSNVYKTAISKPVFGSAIIRNTSSIASSSDHASSNTKSNEANEPTLKSDKLYKIKLIRSLIGTKPIVRKNALAIGLKRTGNTVFHPVTNEMAGIILRIKELVSIQLVDSKTLTRTKQPLGYHVVSRFNQNSVPKSISK
ncbi:hypothetical protein AYI70_g3090 [Smittium culicis]|uniref:Large ribosomal subunit protein uL30-like ferredoxin-like fold domain-containing protein n=1 Tax=Smittium culicis TaxID=133412 RepID=A0A1R1Y5F7_9FUNG|nr:hypothetical protein AYI70_g3090 [Smittium culicis]